jgi:hypothetical protein
VTDEVTTADKLSAVEDQIDALLPTKVAALEPVLLAKGARVPLSRAQRNMQESIVAAHDPEFKALLKKAHDLNLQWNIEEGLY